MAHPGRSQLEVKFEEITETKVGIPETMATQMMEMAVVRPEKLKQVIDAQVGMLKTETLAMSYEEMVLMQVV